MGTDVLLREHKSKKSRGRGSEGKESASVQSRRKSWAQTEKPRVLASTQKLRTLLLRDTWSTETIRVTNSGHRSRHLQGLG